MSHKWDTLVFPLQCQVESCHCSHKGTESNNWASCAIVRTMYKNLLFFSHSSPTCPGPTVSECGLPKTEEWIPHSLLLHIMHVGGGFQFEGTLQTGKVYTSTVHSVAHFCWTWTGSQCEVGVNTTQKSPICLRWQRPTINRGVLTFHPNRQTDLLASLPINLALYVSQPFSITKDPGYYTSHLLQEYGIQWDFRL